MPIINRQDAQEVELYVGRFFAAPSAGRAQALRRLFVEKLDFASATGAVSLAKAPKNVALPSTAERIASIEELHVVYVPLSGDGPDRVRKAEASAAAKLIADVMHGDLLLVMTNPSCSQLHVIYPTFVGAAPSLRRMIIERYLPRRTAVQQLSNIFWYWKDTGSIRMAVDKAFDVEAVTKQFFEDYKRVFDSVMASVKGFGMSEAEQEAKKLFVQTMFNRLMFIYFLSRKGWLKFKGDPDYLNALWQSYRMQSDEKNFYTSRLEVLFFTGLNNPDSRDLHRGVAPLIGDVPFLNGGLFDKTDEDKRPNITVPDEAIDQILHELFDRFNFTVMESTPFDVEVAVDPEMLGKVFEELVTGRHESGSYYTPRPVVAFMCREALKGYLETQNTGASTEASAAFVDHKDTSNLTLPSAPKIGEALARVKVVDPACGSGAYLLGMMQELVELMTALYSAQLSHEAQDLYNLKLRIIEQNLYGADIDQFAVNIAMLRLWLSLAIEYDGPVEKLPPLPNLDFKIVCGDSLLGPDPSPENYGTLFRHRVYQLAGQLADRKARHMRATGQEKTNLTKDIEGLKAQLREALADSAAPEGALDWRVEFAEVFDQNGGFDVTIANPPYIDSERMAKTDPQLRSAIQATYQWTKGNWDIYIAFFERGFNLLGKMGVLAFITPDKWISKPFGEELRVGTMDRISSILKAGRDVFESSNVDAIVSVFTQARQTSFRIYDYAGTQIKLKRIVPKDGLMAPYAYDWLFSEYLEWLVKMDAHRGRLSNLAICENSCATSDAYKLQEFIEEQTTNAGHGDFLRIINTGTIGKYVSKWGLREMVYLGKRYRRPVVRKAVFLDNFQNSYGRKAVRPKLILKGLNLLDACLDQYGSIIPGKTTLMIPSENPETLKVLLAVINSSSALFYLKEKYPASSYNQGTTFTKEMINELPVPEIASSDRAALVSTVDCILEGKQRDPGADITLLQKEIDFTFYKLYGLSAEEIAAVEGCRRSKVAAN